MLAHLRLLLGMRLRAARNGVRFASVRERWFLAGLAAASLALFVVIAGAFGGLLWGTRRLGEDTLHLLIARTLLYLFLLLLGSAVPFAASTLFAPGDLVLLLATPARPAAVVLARLVDVVLVASAQFVVIGVPLLVGSAAALRLPFWAWPVFVALVLLFLALPPLLTAALLLLLARVVGLRRVRAVVALVSVVLAVGLCLLSVSEIAGQANSISRLARGALPDRAWNLSPVPAWMPSTWASDALIGLASPLPARAVAPLLLLLVATLACGAASLAVGRRVLLGETLLEGEGRGSLAAGERTFDRFLRVVPLLSPPARALVAKDTRYLLRDLVLLSQAGIPVILYLVPFVLAGAVLQQGAESLDLFYFSASMIATIAFMETSILGLSSVGLEGRAFWAVLHAPVSVAQFLWAKFVWAFGLSVALCVPLFLISCAVFRAPLSWGLAGAGALGLVCAALCGLAVGIAGLFPRFVYDNPAHRASVSALIWGFVGATGYILIAGIALGGGLFLALQWPERAVLVRTGASVFFALF
uniref:Uncharacterized protein n=1 Tax=uncultured Armatimonadetes bacterium TaxID=157466 RepID=A0A6J4JD35_9BACT|nr:hypothetical protein AVDCRST_MAG63-3239 [uncultured Armatimonadetes bacterium]